MKESTAGLIEIEVACATPDEQVLMSLYLPTGTTAIEAVQVSGVLQRLPKFDADQLCIGVFGRRVEPDQVLVQGDRVELYRPLLIDPKQARRRRARR